MKILIKFIYPLLKSCENNLKINFETNDLHVVVIDLILISFVSKFSVYYIPLNFLFTLFDMAGELQL